MAYQKTNWVNDSLPAINAENLNKIENGIAESNIFRNLFNVGNAKITTNTGLNFNKTNNQILINGSSSIGTDIFLDSPKANKDEEGIILKSGTYTATIKKVSGSLANNPIEFYLRKSNGTNVYNGTIVFTQNIEAGVSDGTAYSSTFTLTEETRLHWLGYFGSDLRTFNNLVLQFQIEESTSATEYTPFAGYIVESGSNDNGSWVKFSDGTMVCRRTFSITLDCRQQWGNLYVATDDNIINFPQEFIETPFVIRDLLTSSSSSCWLINYSAANITTKTYRHFAIARATPSDSVPIQLNLLAIGRWK